MATIGDEIRLLTEGMRGLRREYRGFLEDRSKTVGPKGGFLPPTSPPPTPTPAPGAPSSAPRGPSGTRGTGGSGGAAPSGAEGTGRLGLDYNTNIHANPYGTAAFRGQSRSMEFLNTYCKRVDDIQIPRPGDVTAYLADPPRLVKIAGWRCQDGSEYIDPEAYKALLGPERSGRSSPGTYNPGSAPPRPATVTYAGQPTGQVGVGGNTPVNEPGGLPLLGKAIAASAAQTVTAGDRQVVTAVEKGFAALGEILKAKATGLDLRIRGLT